MVKSNLTKKQRKLIIDNYKLVENFIQKRLKKGDIPISLIDDFISEICWRFCISALYYDKEYGFNFSTYAYGGFCWGTGNILKDKKKQIEDKYLEEIEISYLEKEKKEYIEKEFLYNFLDMVELPKRENNILIDYYFNDQTFARLGKKYNLSRERIRQIIQISLKKLRRIINREKITIEDFYARK